MKFSSQLLALCLLQANAWSTNAFTVKMPAAFSAVALRSTAEPAANVGGDIEDVEPAAGVDDDIADAELAASVGGAIADAEPAADVGGDMEMFPIYPTLETIQGGGTVSTYQMPPWAERCQYTITTNGRPMKGMVQLWLGPIRNTHTLEFDCEDGSKTPYQATLKFKKMSQCLKISTSDILELPIQAAVFVPPPDRADQLDANTEKVWKNAELGTQKQLIQGGRTQGGGGSIRTWNIPDDVDSVQILSWSKDVGKKSFRMAIEVLQGPNNKKQSFSLQCGGGSQPYHGVIQTPGAGWIIRITNKKFVEDGLFQFAVVPYSHNGFAGSDTGEAVSADKPWWQ